MTATAEQRANNTPAQNAFLDLVEASLAAKRANRMPATGGNAAPIPAAGEEIHTHNGRVWALAALEKECEELASTPEGSRNDALNRSAFRAGQLVAPGQITQEEALEALTLAAERAGLPAWEIGQVLRINASTSPLTAGQQVPRGPALRVELSSNPGRLDDGGEPVGNSEQFDDAEFWAARPELAHIRAFALARMASPWAVLGVTLVRTLACVPPWVVLPPLVGGLGSLNLFVALVGPSGAGKGAAEAAARDAVTQPEDVWCATVGSGEGLTRQYAHWDRTEGMVMDRSSVVFECPEVDGLTALSNRQGATLISQIRSAFNGYKLGFAYADEAKRMVLAEHAYRMGLTLGVQPERAAALLDDADGGTPQRFIWMPATDRAITSDELPEPHPWPAQHQQWGELPLHRQGKHLFIVPDRARAEVRHVRAARARGEATALDGHAMLARLKVAAGLAVLNGRASVNDEDWALSSQVMACSTRTRQAVEHTLSTQLRSREQARASAETQRAIAKETGLHEDALQRVARWLIARVGDEWELVSQCKRSVASRDRGVFDEALERLLTTGQIEQEEHSDRSRASRSKRVIRKRR